jgi:putative transposase
MISATLVRLGGKAPDPNTGDYCKARAKRSEAALKEIGCEVAKENESKADPKWLWKHRTTHLIDGFTFKMPDTVANQKAYPQHTAQKPGDVVVADRLGRKITSSHGRVRLAPSG